MTELGESKFSSEQWKTHVLRAQEYAGTNQEYCERNGINPSTFSAYKKRYGIVKSIKRRAQVGAFSKVVPEIIDDGLVDKQRRLLPDAKWLAELIMELMSGR